MNERIRQLALQADNYAEQTVHYYQGQFDGLTWEGKIKQVRDTKFAELIVQECIDIISPYTVRMSRPGEEYLHPIQEIKKHFGVEP